MNPERSTSPESMVCGIEIGGTKTQVVIGVVTDASARIVDRKRMPVRTDQGAGGIREDIEQALDALRAEHGAPTAVGVGFGGPVDVRAGRVACSHQIEGWSDFPITEWLHGRVQAPVIVDNDANTAALAEALMGAGRNHSRVFYMTIGSGIGGGFVMDGNIYHGAPPGECEIGHLRLDRNGPTLESRCSGWAINQRVLQHARSSGPDALGPLAESATREPDHAARHLLPALEAGDPAASGLLDDIAADLGLALSHVSHLFHPTVLILGGGVSKLGEPLRARVQTALQSHLMQAHQPGPQLATAELQDDVVPLGALLLPPNPRKSSFNNRQS